MRDLSELEAFEGLNVCFIQQVVVAEVKSKTQRTRALRTAAHIEDTSDDELAAEKRKLKSPSKAETTLQACPSIKPTSDHSTMS